MSVPNQLFTNNATSLLAAPISPIATSLTVMSGYGVLFPQPIDPDDFFLVTLENQTGTAREIIRVEGRSGDTFTTIVRAQEGTVAQTWGASIGNDTLVDHRVTAETMRQALLQPVGGSGGAGTVDVQWNGVPLTSPADTLNFEGAVTVSEVGGVKTITTGLGILEPSNPPTQIASGATLPGNIAEYAEDNRGFKFFVTLTVPATKQSSTFEVLGNISGDLTTNSEVASWNRVSRVGDNLRGAVALTMDTTLKQVSLTWTNNEPNPVLIQCVRIQHTAV